MPLIGFFRHDAAFSLRFILIALRLLTPAEMRCILMPRHYFIYFR